MLYNLSTITCGRVEDLVLWIQSNIGFNRPVSRTPFVHAILKLMKKEIVYYTRYLAPQRLNPGYALACICTVCPVGMDGARWEGWGLLPFPFLKPPSPLPSPPFLHLLLPSSFNGVPGVGEFECRSPHPPRPTTRSVCETRPAPLLDLCVTVADFSSHYSLV